MAKKVEPDTFEPPHHKLRKDIKTNSIKYRGCQLWGGQRTGKNSETLSGEIHVPYTQHPGLYPADQRHQTTERSMHGFLWCQGTLHISAHKACHKHHQEAAWGRSRTPKRTTLSVTNIIRLLEYCLTSTYFIFQGRFYEQQEGAAMGSPISPIVANMYMEKFEQLAINTAPHMGIEQSKNEDKNCCQ